MDISRHPFLTLLAVLGCICIFVTTPAETSSSWPVELLLAQRFELGDAYTYEMRADLAPVSAGYLIVVQADPSVTVPRQSLGPILFAGEWPLEVINTGRDSGLVVAIVPAVVDLQTTPFFYAKTPVLPESLSPAVARGLAGSAGDPPPGSEAVTEALAAAGPSIFCANRYQLYLRAADLIERYAPSESDLVRGLRAPLLGQGVPLSGAQPARDPRAVPPRRDPDGREDAGKQPGKFADRSIPGLIQTQLAGSSLADYPYFEYIRAVNSGSPTEVAIDTGRFPLAGMTAKIHVVEARTTSEWDLDRTLVDVSSGGPETVTFVAGTISANTFTVDSGTLNADAGVGMGVAYDVVIDIDGDNLLGPGDVIDGYGEAGFYTVHDLTLPGPLAVSEINYSGGTWLGQNTYYPTDISGLGELPLVVVSHGNGHNYLWYDHIGFHLASYGYIVMSHQNNTQPGIGAASTTTLTNTDYFLANLGTIAGGVLNGHVDSSRIIWIGHSRGGEGIVRAYDRVFDAAWIPVEYGLSDLRLLSSMAPTAYLPTDASHPHQVPYHLWLGGADNDVYDCPVSDGELSPRLLDRAERFRQSISLHGVGHGDFHDGGGSSVATGPCLVGRPATHTLMRGYLLPLVEFYVQGNVAAEDFLWRQWERFRPIGAPTSQCVVVDLYYRPGDLKDKYVIDDFETESSPLVSSSGGVVSFNVTELTEGALDEGNTDFTHDISDPMNGMTVGGVGDSTHGIVFTFDTGATQSLEFGLVPDHRNLTQWTYLSFRAAQATRHPLTISELGDVTFTVTLIDTQAVESSINIGAYGGGLEEPYQRTGCGIGAGWNNEFETIRLRLTDFLNDGSDLDLTDIHSVILRFGPAYGSPSGRIGLDQVELVDAVNLILADGFESGDTSAWSEVVGR